jgi:hypothetical protein
MQPSNQPAEFNSIEPTFAPTNPEVTRYDDILNHLNDKSFSEKSNSLNSIDANEIINKKNNEG